MTDSLQAEINYLRTKRRPTKADKKQLEKLFEMERRQIEIERACRENQ